MTYHGPGQLVLYVLVDVRRSKLSVRELVTCLETAIINTLAKSGIEGLCQTRCPGVYVKSDLGMEAKLASLGLRIRKGLLLPRAGPQRRHGHGPSCASTRAAMRA